MNGIACMPYITKRHFELTSPILVAAGLDVVIGRGMLNVALELVLPYAGSRKATDLLDCTEVSVSAMALGSFYGLSALYVV